MHCDQCYIGETGRLLSERLKEEKDDVVKHKPKSEIAEHCWTLGHHMDWDNASILQKEQAKDRRWFLESLFIKSTPGCFANQTHPCSSSWLPLLQSSLPKVNKPTEVVKGKDTLQCADPNHKRHATLAPSIWKTSCKPGSCAYGKCRFCCLLTAKLHSDMRSCKHHKYSSDNVRHANRYHSAIFGVQS